MSVSAGPGTLRGQVRKAGAAESEGAGRTEETDDADEAEDESCVPDVAEDESCVPDEGPDDEAVPLTAGVAGLVLADPEDLLDAVPALADLVAFVLAGENAPFAEVAVEAGDEADVAGTLAADAPVCAGAVLEQLAAGVGVTAA